MVTPPYLKATANAGHQKTLRSQMGQVLLRTRAYQPYSTIWNKHLVFVAPYCEFSVQPDGVTADEPPDEPRRRLLVLLVLLSVGHPTDPTATLLVYKKKTIIWV